jgi:hypothetical protein
MYGVGQGRERRDQIRTSSWSLHHRFIPSDYDNNLFKRCGNV